MHVYGELFGTLTAPGTLSGELSAPEGISGLLTIPSAVGVDVYDGDYLVIPKAYDEQVLETANKLLLEDVTVTKVPYYETSNLFDGKTAYIAEDTNGN